ncbi:hypothetical protein AJ80_05104 [Polytolypa hystricis UAMH7299]|uniref:Zn(2)-C6 fungal-type domain-containing protein n=1 Tax=Polytolypa hystricis (strain UAMH7299) TaxID=1447883 RepID=A0A2B7Y6R2_POLH7|nr:hypothetical protein AJ80_05104 [Polytolypa hystricis UAMH7299]
MTAGKERIRERRRCLNTCENCKRRKERCDGNQPCRRCIARRVHDECRFSQRRGSLTSPPAAQDSNNNKNNGGGTSVQTISPPAQRNCDGCPRLIPLSPAPSILEGSRLIQDTKGKYMFIGDAANLSFLQTIRRVINDSLGSCPFVDDPLRNFMVEASPVGRPNWIHAIATDRPPKPDLNEAKYLIRWFMVATGCVMEIFDEEDLCTHLSEWLESPAEEANEISSIYCSYGRYLTASGLMEDPSIALVQSSALITMYLLGASRRNTAFMYLGLAVRAAYTLGLHQQDVAALFGPEEYATRERLWKAIRVLDLFMSASLGRPPSTCETRDTTAKPNYSASNDLCAIFETILTDFYAKRMISTELLEQTSERHRRWAGRLLEGLVADNIQPEAYYWTIILLARPFLVERISSHISLTRRRSQSEAEIDRTPSSPSDTILVHACIDSAIRTIDLLQGLLHTDQLPKRLPFIVNSVFVSALVLGLALFGDFDQVFPLEKRLKVAQKLLTIFSTHDALAKRYCTIVEDLQNACEAYFERRTQYKLEAQGRLVGGIFGSLHNDVNSSPKVSDSMESSAQMEHRNSSSSSSADTTQQTPDDSEPPQRRLDGSHQAVNARPVAFGDRPWENSIHEKKHTEGSVDPAQRISTDLDIILDGALPPMSPRMLMFDSFAESIPLFPTVDFNMAAFD